MSELVVIGFPDEATARLAYDEVLNLSDNHDLLLEGLAIRTTGPTGRIRLEIPDQLTVGSKASGPQFADFLVGILEARDGSDADTGGIWAATNMALSASPAVIVIMASHIAWKRFRATMSFFDGITIDMPAGT